MEQVHLLIKNAKVFNSYLKKFISANVAVKDGKFYYIDRKQDTDFQTDNVIDAKGSYMIPGLTDIHMHIESSMTTPAFFGKCAGENGVTTVVSEPHEMANVKGIRGILEMISAAKNAPIDIFYGIPSSVPSTSEKLETTGGIIDCSAMKHLLEEKDVVCVGEIMNYRQIIRENDLEISRFLEYLKKEHPGYVIEGHCPSLLDLDLAKFLYLGINGDHTEHTLEEVKQRIENGMFFEIQDKMLKPEILEYICQNQLYEYCSFVTDDTMADALYEQGPLNAVVQKAIDMGFPMEQAIYCATYTPCQRMHFYDRGAIAPGKLADFMLLKDPSVLKPEAVFKNGVSIYVKDEPQLPLSASSYEFPADFSLLQDFLCTILYVSKRLFTAAEAKLQISTVKYLDIHKVTILIRAVGFQSKAFMTNGRRTEPGSRTKACGRIKGSSVKNNFCFLKTAVTTDKIFNIW